MKNDFVFRTTALRSLAVDAFPTHRVRYRYQMARDEIAFESEPREDRDRDITSRCQSTVRAHLTLVGPLFHPLTATFRNSQKPAMAGGP